MKTPSGANLTAKRILAVVACVALGVVFWDSPVVYPLKLLVVMMHESGHALATLLVGGSVQTISIRPDQSGQCLSLLPPSVFGKIFVYSAGYIGSAIAGAALLIATLRFELRRWVLGAGAVWLTLMGLIYFGDVFTLVFCLVIASIMAGAAKALPDGVVDVVNLFIAAFSGLYVVFDVRDDLWNSEVRARSDASLLADFTYVPSLVWAALWTVAALAVLGAALWISVSPTRRALRAERRLARV